MCLLGSGSIHLGESASILEGLRVAASKGRESAAAMLRAHVLGAEQGSEACEGEGPGRTCALTREELETGEDVVITWEGSLHFNFFLIGAKIRFLGRNVD